MKKITDLTLAALLLNPLVPLQAAEQADSPVAKSGKLLLNEDFSGASLPAKWQPGGRLNSFTIVEGVLQGVCPPDDKHGPAIGVPIEGHNLTIQFSVRLMKPGLVLFLVDGDSRYGRQAHLLRIGLGDKFAAL